MLSYDMIVGYFGLPGSGKTYKMSVDALRYLKEGYNIYSTYPLKGAYVLTFDILVSLPRFRKPALLLLDEVQFFASSRSWKQLNPNLYILFSQGRKLGLNLFYTAQDSSRVDKTLREVTNYFCDISFCCSERFPLRFLDVYTTNASYSLKTNRYSRKFFILRRSYFRFYDTNYIIDKAKVHFSSFEWQKWNL